MKENNKLFHTPEYLKQKEPARAVPGHWNNGPKKSIKDRLLRHLNEWVYQGGAERRRISFKHMSSLCDAVIDFINKEKL